jgi:tetratricopeptide (TPR) repeat protein
MGQFNGAIAAYKNALKADPRMHKAQYNLAVAYQKAELWEETLQAYKKFVDMAGGSKGMSAQVTRAKEIIPQLEEYLSQF